MKGWLVGRPNLPSPFRAGLGYLTIVDGDKVALIHHPSTFFPPSSHLPLTSHVRAGVGHLTIVDGDKVDLTNKNRQLPALESTVGLPKAEVRGGGALEGLHRRGGGS